MSETPRTIPQLWHELDKRLALIEAAQAVHAREHEALEARLQDHESRIRSGLALGGILTGSGGLLSVIALIRSLVER